MIPFLAKDLPVFADNLIDCHFCPVIRYKIIIFWRSPAHLVNEAVEN